MWRARRGNFGAGEPFDLPALRARRPCRGIWALGAPVIILGGIYGGVFSPTEAAAVACVYAIFVTRFVFRELSWRDIVEAGRRDRAVHRADPDHRGLRRRLLLASDRQPGARRRWWLDPVARRRPWSFLLVVNLLLLLVGCFLDPLSAILLLTPLLIPVVKALGIDTVHFGIVVMVNLAIGLFHPPFGINIFVAQSVLGIDLKTIYRGILPFVVLYLIALA